MNHKLCFSFFLFLMPLVAQTTLPVGSRAPANWTLKDVNDKVYDLKQFNGKTILLIGGDKESQETNRAWATGSQRVCGQQLSGLGIADVSAVPKLLRGYYRNHLRTDATQMGVPLLLDWDGSVAKSFHFKSGVSNVFVIGTDGVISYVAAGAPSDTEIKRLCSVVK